MSDQLAPLTSAVSDRYRIQREVGVGGMATVYLATDVKHDREVALKVFRPELAAVLGADRFLNEIKITARLDHPHILTLIDSGATDGFLFYVMPFVRGESLRDKLRRERQLGIEEALLITRQVASALDYAHRQGVIHRDIKPENILLQEGEAMLTDFGIAMAVKEAGGNRMTETGLSLGTPQYMSPEQATGDRNLDKRSDIYSLAAVLYEMLAGEPPHTGATVQAIIAKLMTERPTRVRVVRDTVPEGIDSAVAKALAKVPADRFATASDFANALNVREERAEGKWRMNWKVLVPVAVAGVVALAVLAVLSRREAPAIPIDRAQLTSTGYAGAASLSPDGSRLAFGEKTCDNEGLCKNQLVIQEADGSGRLVLGGGAAAIWRTQWTPDGRHIVYDGSYGSDRWGSFVISTLGGQPRYLGCCNAFISAPDTLLLRPPANPLDRSHPVIRIVTLSDGQVRDSVPLTVASDGRFYIAPLAGTSRFVVVSDPTNMKKREVLLVERDGSILSRTPLLPENRNRFVSFLALPKTQSILVLEQRHVGGKDIDVYRLDVAGKRFASRLTPVVQGLQSSAGAQVSWDEKVFTFHEGPIETTLFSADAQPLSSAPIPFRKLLQATDGFGGRPSPDGARIVLSRKASQGTRQGIQFSVLAASGGAETKFSGILENVRDFGWSPDGRSVIFSTRADDATKFEQIDVATGKRRMILSADVQEGGVNVLPNGGLVLIGDAGHTIRVFSPDGKLSGPWQAPAWIAGLGEVVTSPDSRFLASISWDQPNDSMIVARTDLTTGVTTRLAAVGGEGWTDVAWLPNGTLIFGVFETRGALMLYALDSAGPPRPIRKLPYLNATYRFSRDGKRILAFSFNDRTDIYAIRNFGDFLKR